MGITIKFIKKDSEHKAQAYNEKDELICSLSFDIKNKYLNVRGNCFIKKSDLSNGDAKCFLIANGKITKHYFYANSYFLSMTEITDKSYHRLRFRDFVNNYNFEQSNFEFKPKWTALNLYAQASDFGFEQVVLEEE